ncbi:MAG: hypothetical protein NC416_06320 [Eubacterium sp.]|nr:hypothetical protein [Eubacterium sp.]
MGRRIRIAVSCIVTIGLTVIFLWRSADLMERKESDIKNAPFFEQKEDFDVLFFGTSRVGYGIYPLELWNDYGIVSYNLGGHGNPLATTYWTMENAMDYTTPKLVVIDCYLLSYMVKTHSSFSSVHLSLDAFPISRNKIAAVWDLLDDKEAGDRGGLQKPRTRLEVLWDYAVYHSRWNDLWEEDFVPEFTLEKGAEHYPGIVPMEKTVRIPSESRMEEDTVSVRYLEKMIEDCDSRGIDVLLTYLPSAANEICQKEANRVYDIAEQYGVDYINFLALDVVNYGTDYCDTDCHLNPSGARKVTDYIGQYITEHYTIPDRRNQEAYGHWYADYEQYVKYKEDNLRNLESMDKYLMMLADKNYSAAIEIHNAELLESDYYLALLENLQADRSSLTEGTDFLFIQEAGKKVWQFENFLSAGRSVAAPAGGFSMFENSETGTYGVYLEGEELYTVTDEQNPDADVRIVVFDKDTMEIVDHAYFTFQSKFSK